MVIPAWLSYVYETNNPVLNTRLDFLGQHLFNGAKGKDVIKSLKTYYQSTGAPVSWRDANLEIPDEATLYHMAHDVMQHGELGKLKTLNEGALVEIYKRIG
jgi:alcohol dehydrogenase YqhD (iron-dependent ADH family)